MRQACKRLKRLFRRTKINMIECVIYAQDRNEAELLIAMADRYLRGYKNISALIRKRHT